ncbi:MAG: hypothetical protein LBJ73_01115 [Rickettsiales bacterium]|jgi:hypothetical protein|nr:hypothetical protein [Rickettsiales bacterium]
MAFDKFLQEDKAALYIEGRSEAWAHPFDDWRESLKIAFAILIYCAENGLKISYAGLGRISNMPEQYTTTGRQALGIVAGYMLECIGRYCQTLPSKPRLTSLCVSYVSGFPGGRYYEFFDPENANKSLERQKQILLELFRVLQEYDWGDVKHDLGVNIDGMAEKINAETFAQDNFYIPKNQRDLDEKVAQLKEEAKYDPDKIEEIDADAKEESRKLSGDDRRFEQDTDLKKFEAYFVAGFISVWSVAVLVILCSDYWSGGENIPTSVYITLFATTLVEVFGLQWLVLKHLFPNGQKSKK